MQKFIKKFFIIEMSVPGLNLRLSRHVWKTFYVWKWCRTKWSWAGLSGRGTMKMDKCNLRSIVIERTCDCQYVAVVDLTFVPAGITTVSF